MKVINKNNQGFVQIVLVLVIVAVAIGGAYYFGTLKNNTGLVSVVPTLTPIVSTQSVINPTINPTLDPTANWKTYSNTKYGFEFKYPIDQKLDDNGKGEIGIGKVSLSINKLGQNAPKVTQKKINEIIWDMLYFDPKTPMGGGPHSFYQTKYSEYYYVITYYDKETQQVADQILSTFKFTK